MAGNFMPVPISGGSAPPPPTSGGTPAPAIPYPAPTTPQSAAQNAAYTGFQAAGAQATDWANQMAARMTGAGTAADAAMANFAGFDPTANLSSFNPANLSTFQPTDLSKWLGQLNLGPLKLGAVPTATASTSSYVPTDLQGFDPTAAMSTYAAGAEQTFNKNLTEQLRQLTNKSAGAGRLDTGMFDEDTGRVVMQNAADYSSAIAGQATQLSGQKLSALTSIDQLLAQQAEQNASLETNVSEANAADATTARGQDVAAYSADTARQALGLSGAEAIDQMGLTRATALDQMGLTRAGEMDTLGFNKANATVADYLARETNATNAFGAAEGAASQYASANLAYTSQERMIQDMIDYMTKMGMGPYGNTSPGGGGAGGSSTTGDPYAIYEEQAKELGVPFTRPSGG